MEEEYKELTGKLFLTNYLSYQVTPPSRANYSKLPYQDLSPRQFEQFCLKYAYAVHGVSRCSIYGNPGQDQHGLDILVAETDGKYILYQCKHVETFTSHNLKEAIIKFSKGRWFDSTSKFILFSSNELTETGFLNEFEDQRSVLEAKGITLEKMGKWEADEALKSHPAIVDEFFGIEWVKKFNSSPQKEVYLESLQPLPDKKQYPEVRDYIARKLHNPLKFKTYYGRESFLFQTLMAWIEECHHGGRPVRTLIRSNAGLGKSKEIEFIAHHFCEANQWLFPLIVPLKNYNGDLEKLIGAFFEKWKEIPKERLFLMFDGLDEVPNDLQKAFTKEFNILLQQFEKSNILTSARSNYSTAWIGTGADQSSTLNVQTLQPLSDFDIQEYLNQRIPIAGTIARFNGLVKGNKLTELLYNPFYLKNLVDIFLGSELSFPSNRADAIKKIIQLKLKNDALKYSLTAEQTSKFDLVARRLAVFLTLTGRNSISLNFLKNLTDIPLDEIRYCSLFKLELADEDEIVFFEHNNFQEYLAAVFFAGLDWGRLATALFHEPGGIILKPRLINTANYLFTLLDTSGVVYKSFFKILKDHNQELLLNFEKDKLPFPARIEIFKAIIESGKKQEIYFLRSDIDSQDLLEFIEFNRVGFEYIIEQFNDTDIESVYRECLVELLFFFKPEKIMGKNKLILHQKLQHLVTLDILSSTHDVLIDTMGAHGFYKPADIRMVLTKCPGINNQMVRGAWLKLVRKAHNPTYFKPVLQSAKILFENPRRTVAGLEYEFMCYVKEQLNPANINQWLSFMQTNMDLLSNMLENLFLPEKRALLDEIYLSMAKIFNQKRDNKIYDQFIKVIYAMQEFNNESLWGNPAIFFIETGTRKKAFFNLLEDGDNLMFRFAINSNLVDTEILDEVIEKYKNNEFPERNINIVRNLLSYHKKNDLFEYLNNALPPTYFEQFTAPDIFDWNAKIIEWQEMDFKLLSDRDLFVAEAAKLYKYVAELKDFDEEMGWIELQYNEKANLKRRVNNDIIFRTIEQNKIGGGYQNFLKWLDGTEWNWFVFYNSYNYLMSKKIAIPDNLLSFLKTYTISDLVPLVNFRKTYRLDKYKRVVHQTHAGTIRKLFMEGIIELPEPVLLDLLSFDAGGFSKTPPGEHLEERLFMKIYNLIADKSLYKERILLEIGNGYLNWLVLESHCTACLAFHYPEAVPELQKYLSVKSIPDDVKQNIVTTIISLDNKSEIFVNQLESIKKVQKYWQFEILKTVNQSNFLLEILPANVSIIKLIEKSIAGMANENRLKFDLIKAGIKAGSEKAANAFFSYLPQETNWHMTTIEDDDFMLVEGYSPLKIINKCFALLPSAFQINDEMYNRMEAFLKNLITNMGKKDYKTMVYALKRYESFISKYRSVNQSAIMVRWYEKELIKAYYLSASKFDEEEQVLKWAREIEAA